MTKFVEILFGGAEPLQRKLGAATAPFQSLGFGAIAVSEAIAEAVPAVEDNGPEELNEILAEIAALEGASDPTVVADFDDGESLVVLRTPTNTEIRIRGDGLVRVNFPPPSQAEAHAIILRAAEMRVGLSAEVYND